MAWFIVAPKSKAGQRRERVSRFQQTKDRGGTPLFPEKGDLGYLLGYWRDAGMSIPGGMDAAPLTAQELLSWQNGTQTPLAPWEFQMLLDMSREYVGFMTDAREADCPPPYGEVADIDRTALSKRLGQAFSALAKRKPK